MDKKEKIIKDNLNEEDVNKVVGGGNYQGDWGMVTDEGHIIHGFTREHKQDRYYRQQRHLEQLVKKFRTYKSYM